MSSPDGIEGIWNDSLRAGAVKLRENDKLRYSIFYSFHLMYRSKTPVLSAATPAP